MEPISLWLALLAGWALTHFWLLPMTTSAWKAKSTREKMARAGALAVLKKLRDICAIGATTVAIVLLAVIALSGLAGTSLSVPRILISWLAGYYEVAKAFAENYATGTALLGIAGMVVVLYMGARQARAHVVDAWSQQAASVFARLRDNPDELNELLREEALRPQADRIAQLVAQLDKTTDEGLRDGLHREISSALSAVAVEVAAKEVKFEEKIDESVRQETAPAGAMKRIARVLASSRFCEDVGLVKKHLTYAVTALLFVSLVGWSAEPMANSLRLAVNNLRINEAYDEARHDMQAAMSQAAVAEPESARATVQIPSPAAVRTVTQLLARAAARDLLRAPLVDASAGLHETGSDNEFIRAAITGDQIEAGADADATARVRSEVAREVAAPGDLPSGARRAQEHAQALLQPQVETLGQEHPGVFWRLKTALETRYDEVLSPLEAQGKLTERVIDEVFASADFHPAGELGKQGQKLVKEFGKKAAQTWVDAFLQQYMTDAIVSVAHGDVRERTPFAFETSEEAHRFVAGLQAASDSGWVGGPSEQADQKMSTAVAQEVASHYQDEPGMRESIAHPLSGYDQIFPRRDEVAVATNLDNLDSPAAGNGGDAGGGIGGGGGNGGKGGAAEAGTVREPAPSVHAPSLRPAMGSVATEFRMASLSFRVRGVLVGQPMSGKDPGITDLRWQVIAARPNQPTRVRIEVSTASAWVDIGTFDAAVVNQALRYAADRRVVATTITPGDGKIVGRVTYLHPALVNTPLGCRIVEADRLIDTFTMDTKPASAASPLGRLERDRAAMAQWIDRVDLAERVASDSTCPKDALDEALVHRPAAGLDFSPALRRELDGFYVAQEKARPGSVAFLRQADACASGPANAMAACVCAINKTSVSSGAYWMPEDHTSQFRERTAALGPDLSWLRRSPDRLANVDLWVHTTFAIHRESAGGEARVDESSAAEIAFPNDELDALRQFSSMVLPIYVARQLRSPSYDDFMAPVEDFIVLQRLMRAALDGKLAGFPVRKLIDLERATHDTVPNQPTIRWEPASRDQAVLLTSLNSAGDDAARAYTSWRADVEAREESGQPACAAVSK